MRLIHATRGGNPAVFDADTFRGAFEPRDEGDPYPICVIALDGNEITIDGTIKQLLGSMGEEGRGEGLESARATDMRGEGRSG